MNIIEIIARGMASAHKDSWDNLKPGTQKYFEDQALAAVAEMNNSTDIQKSMTVAQIIQEAMLFKLQER